MKKDYLYTVEIRFYEELNDFLPHEKRKKSFNHKFFGKPTVKEVIEGLGVPHTEIDLILINGESVSFDHHVKDGDRMAVYPRYESLDISKVTRLRPCPLRELRFIADVHLGKLSRYLRMLGFDILYQADLSDEKIIEIARKEGRMILTRDLGILKSRQVTHGYFLRHTDPKEQMKEVVLRFDLKDQIHPFSRCLECNALLRAVSKEKIEKRLLPDTKKYFNTFYECPSCERLYWEGSHYERMESIIDFVCS